jgi:2'-5' RNA ligase
VRAFIAIDLEPEIKESLRSLVRDLRATRADIRWVSGEGIHLTLKFLGPIDETQALGVKEILKDVASHHHAFPLRLEGTGAFPGEISPRVLWVGLAGEPELLALQDDLDNALEAKGFEREKRAFSPHLTLGRVKGPERVAKAVNELAKHREESFGAMTVRKVALFESLLHPDGAEYRIVFEALLP